MKRTNARIGLTYLLPVRWTQADPESVRELTAYLSMIATVADEVLVVDGSPPPLFEQLGAALSDGIRHLRPHPDLDFEMGKANGVVTGMRECSHELVVIADDDVRYQRHELLRVAGLLAKSDLVRPQNYFTPLPWHARWDTARTLLNRVFTGDPGFPVGDFPGTLAVRRSTFRGSGAYDGNALFENLELMRTIRAAGGTVLTPLDLYVARRPPTAAHFISQRMRQAYDDLAMPGRLAAFLGLGPLVVEAGRRGRWRWVAAAALASAGVAELGRRRAGGDSYFPLSGSLLAPVWIAERSVCSWLAVAARLRGGVRYGERRLKLAATPMRTLRQRHSDAAIGSPRPALGPEADRLVGPVAERPDP